MRADTVHSQFAKGAAALGRTQGKWGHSLRLGSSKLKTKTPRAGLIPCFRAAKVFSWFPSKMVALKYFAGGQCGLFLQNSIVEIH